MNSGAGNFVDYTDGLFGSFSGKVTFYVSLASQTKNLFFLFHYRRVPPSLPNVGLYRLAIRQTSNVSGAHRCPFSKLDLRNQSRFEPDTVLHLFSDQRPLSAFLLWQIGERASRDLHPSSHNRDCAGPRRVFFTRISVLSDSYYY
jgi:hypothetical protein